jgi:hypothetical protein
MTTDFNADIYIRRNPPNRKLHGLIIGNAYYVESEFRLKFPAYDAQSWTEFLVQKGFEITLLTNATRMNILDAFERHNKRD